MQVYLICKYTRCVSIRDRYENCRDNLSVLSLADFASIYIIKKLQM